MNLSQILQMIPNRTAYYGATILPDNHPSLRGGVPIIHKPYQRVQDYEGTAIEDGYGGMELPTQMDVQPVEISTPATPRTYAPPRQAPTLNNSGSQELMRQAQAILAGLGNDPRPQIKAPNNESILLALLPALFGAGTNYIGQLGQGYMAGQNQELARIEQERQRREADVLRQAAMVQTQAQNMGNREDLIYTQDSQNYRNWEDNTRTLTNTEMIQNALNERFGMGDQTKRDLAGDKLDLDREKFEAGFVAKMWALALKDANMKESVTEADIQRLQQIAQDIGGEKYAKRLPMPGIGDSWAKIKNDADMAYKQLVLDERKRHNGVMEGQGQARIDKPTGSRGGGGSGGGARPPALGGKLTTISLKVAEGKAAAADANIKKMKESQKYESDPKKRIELEKKIRAEVVTREYWKRVMKGESPILEPFAPGAPTTDAAKDAAAKAKADAEKAAAAKALAANQIPAPSGAGISIENSYAEGGNRSQKTQAEVDAEKKKAADAVKKKADAAKALADAKKKADEAKAAEEKRKKANNNGPFVAGSKPPATDKAKKKDKKVVTPPGKDGRQGRVNELGEKIKVIG